jgi:hypothetical protein
MIEKDNMTPTKERVRRDLPGVAALGLLAIVAVVGIFGLNSASDEENPSRTEAPPAVTHYLAEEGDSAWSIATKEIESSVIPRDDVNIESMVASIVESNGDIQPGQLVEVIDLPNKPLKNDDSLNG